MLELDARDFVQVVKEIRRLNTILETQQNMEDHEQLTEMLRHQIHGHTQNFIRATLQFGARASWVAAKRLSGELLAGDAQPFTIGQLRVHLKDIEARFDDELGFAKLFVVSDQKASLFDGPEQQLGEETCGAYPSLRFDCDEAARCLGLGRPTASVFHSMRMIEIALGALSKRLDIPDPAKATDRNWGNMLKAIRAAIDTQYPPKGRLPNTQGALLEEVYASLDSIKNPWRNATMHVESVYTDDEARHIFACTIVLVQKMAKLFDEQGVEPQPVIPGIPPAIG